MTHPVYLKEKVHEIRGSLSVLSGFIHNYAPQNDDDQTYYEVVKKSFDKLRMAVEEIDCLSKNQGIGA